MGQFEPPSAKRFTSVLPTSSVYFIGQDSHGHWVVQDQQHLHGGLFVDRADALRFALFENGKRPQAVVMVPGVLELDLTASVNRAQPAIQRQPAREERLGVVGPLS